MPLRQFDRDKIEGKNAAACTVLAGPDSADLLGTGQNVAAIPILAGDPRECDTVERPSFGFLCVAHGVFLSELRRLDHPADALRRRTGIRANVMANTGAIANGAGRPLTGEANVARPDRMLRHRLAGGRDAGLKGQNQQRKNERSPLGQGFQCHWKPARSGCGEDRLSSTCSAYGLLGRLTGGQVKTTVNGTKWPGAIADMPDGLVVGIYVERTGALAIRAQARTRKDGVTELDYIDAEEMNWQSDNAEDATSKLTELGRLVGRASGDDLAGIAVAGYGPFVSLVRSDPDFGKLDDAAPHMPLRDQNLKTLLCGGVANAGVKHSYALRIHTDADACALGEAQMRGLPDDHLLCYLLVTEGIGLGIVRGRTLHSSALHPEIGILHVRYDRHDPMKPSKTDDLYLYGLSLAEGASNRSIRERLALPEEKWGPLSGASKERKEAGIEKLRAYYLAQACLACTVILAPHQIVLGTDHDPTNRLVMSSNTIFRKFLSRRAGDRQPLFRYKQLEKNSFIAAPTSVAGLSALGDGLRVTGAVGMCVAAGRAE